MTKLKYTGFHRALEIDHQSHRRSWQVHVCSLIEADQIDVLRETYQKKHGKTPSYNAIVIKAVALALKELEPRFPELNCYLQDWLGWKSIVSLGGISAGASTALDSEEAVVVGVVLEPQTKDLLTITEEMRKFSDPHSSFVKDSRMFHSLPKVIQRFAHGLSLNIRSIRYKNRGSFCLNPVGKFGVDLHLSLPQTSSLQFGLGEVRERVVARDGSPFVTNSFYLTLSFDRRLMNGRPACMLLDRISEILNHAQFNG